MNATNSDVVVNKKIYIGLFLITLATMMYELLLTRVFSVILFYHFAFMAVSIAMFGMTAGATAIYFAPRLFPKEKTEFLLFVSSLLFSITTALSFWLEVSIPFQVQFSSGLAIATTYLILSVPFIFSGITVCLTLTRFLSVVGKMYAVDLAGAALGCLALVALLDMTDGPTAVVWVSQLISVGALLFALSGKKKTQIIVAAVWLALLTGLAISNPSTHLVRLTWSKGDESIRPLFEKWNCFSRVRVYGDPDSLVTADGWGLSPILPESDKVRQLHLDIDSFASTVLTRFNADIGTIEALKYDLTNLVHYIRPHSDVMVIGAGGGRDILAALAFAQNSVTAAEINPIILEAVNLRFGDFTGNLDRNPRVHMVNKEARSFLAGNPKQFDIIQLSLIDTFAASSAGAFSLTENALYTQQAWDLFLHRLSNRGILSCTRWYTRKRPGEIYRITALAVKSLEDSGITNPRDHIVLLRLRRNALDGPNASGLGCILVSKSPFTAKDLTVLAETCARLHFEIVLSPTSVQDPVLEKLLSADAEKFIADYPIRIDAPTDDSPFFFQMVRLKDWCNIGVLDQERMVSAYTAALFSLGTLLILVIGLTGLFVLAPLLLIKGKLDRPGSKLLLLFFSAIGLGFIMVEIALIQRFNMFLGVPIYGLSVTLFTLLLTSAAGSHLSQLSEKKYPGSARYWLAALLSILVLFGLFHRLVLEQFVGSPTDIRILVTVALISPLGFVMGCAFPLGMTQASRRAPDATPWYWGLNGALSVCGSVLSVIIAIGGGISLAYAAGLAAYILAIVAYFLTIRCKPPASSTISRKCARE